MTTAPIAVIYSRQGNTYVFSLATHPGWGGIDDRMVGKHEEPPNPELLGRDVIAALDAFGRLLTAEELETIGNVAMKEMGCSTERELYRGLAIVSVVVEPDLAEYSLRALRVRGLSAEGSEENSVVIPLSASATELGRAVAERISASRELSGHRDVRHASAGRDVAARIRNRNRKR